MFAAMEHITPDECISNIITKDNINKSIDRLAEVLPIEMHYTRNLKNDAQLYTDWSQCHLKCMADTYKKKKASLAKLERNIKFYTEKLRIYEKSLWSASSDDKYDKDDASWLMQLKEKNQRIDMLKSELFRYERDCELIGHVDDIYFVFYLDSITRQILELELQIATLKDIEKSMKDHVGSSTQEILENKNDKNDESKTPMGKRKEWKDLLNCLAQSLSHIHAPTTYWSNRLYKQQVKSHKLMDIEQTLTTITSETSEAELQETLLIVKIMIERYVNTWKIYTFIGYYYNNTPAEIQRILAILNKQLHILANYIQDTSELHKEISLAATLNEQNRRVTKLEDQYAKLTKKSGKYTQDRIASLSDNMIKYRTEIEAVQSTGEKSMEKHENECKIIMAKKYVSTLDAEEREYPITVEEQQKEELSDKQKKSDEKKMNDEAKAQHFKGYQTNEKSQKGHCTEMEMSREMKEIENKLWKVKCDNFRQETSNQLAEIRYKMHKNMLNELMQSGEIDKFIATYKTPQPNPNVEEFLKAKLQLYYNIEQADYVQAAVRHKNIYYDRLVKENVAKNAYVTSQNDTSKKCDTCEILNHKLKYATKVICDISQEITTTSARFHMLPFKKFVGTISEYIMTKEKAKSKRRNKRNQRKH